ncbi:MAG: thiol protease/hemagglutinin PrtT [Bacteroidales bacterium]|nr:thiol protease/hemagglutinin PrtT [Bacteroidales bacterium]
MKKIFLSLLFSVLGFVCFSQEVDEKVSRIIAENFFLENYGFKKNVTETLVKEYKGHPSLYINNMQDGGWVIVPANRNLNPVVAYSDEGAIALNEGPDVFWDWMEQYGFIVDIAVEENWHKEDRHKKWDKLLSEDSKMQLKTYVEETYLVSSRWGQSMTNDGQCPGYNSLSPNSLYCGYDNCDKCTAGCASVAMGQLINYWGFSYGDYVDFDWWNMADSLHTSRPNFSIEQISISYMLRMVGNKNNTNYCSGGCDSGTSRTDIVNGLLLIGYKDMITYQKKWFTLYNTWVNYLKNEIEAERPVIYVYISPHEKGHAFICDGYNSRNDNFHFNLGWNNCLLWCDFEDLFEPNNAGSYDFQNGGTHYCIVNISPDVMNDLSLTNVTISYIEGMSQNKTYQSKGSISVAGNNTTFVVQDNSSCRFIAKDSVVLKPGFHANAGTSLLCKIFKRPTLKSYIEDNYQNSFVSIDEEYPIVVDKILIYPNPVKDNVTIQFCESDICDYQITIFNVMGKEIEKFATEKNKIVINTIKYPSGIYFVDIKTNGKIYSKSFIKQ